MDWDDEGLRRLHEVLRRIAARHLEKEREGHTLQPTALAHEAWLRLSQAAPEVWSSRARFAVVASGAMRRILIDHARARGSGRRPDPARRVPLEGLLDDAGEELTLDLLELDEALDELERLKPRHRQVIELRFFGGLTVEETASVLGYSRQTIEADWRTARAWLCRRLGVS